MSDDFVMRMRLQQVAAYRELCRSVRRSGRGNIGFALLMSFLAYLHWQAWGNPVLLALYGILIGGEIAVGLFKWAFPSAEGHLLDGFVLFAFAGIYLGFQVLVVGAAGRPNPVSILFSLLLLAQAINRFKFYAQLRRMFAERPSAEHMAWFDDLVREIRTADPEADELALDLPTTPHWKAKLLGATAFFVAPHDGAVLVAGPNDFQIVREKADRGTGRRKALLNIHDYPYPEFEIADATWSNYQKWRVANVPATTGIE